MNTDKLLRAFIKASGYEIETLLDYKERKLTKQMALHHFEPAVFGVTPTRCLVAECGSMGQSAYLVDDDGMYTERLTSPIVDYKVTKKIKTNNANPKEFIKGHGYASGVFVSNKGRYYRSLIGGGVNALNYEPLSDRRAWVEYANEKD